MFVYSEVACICVGSILIVFFDNLIIYVFFLIIYSKKNRQARRQIVLPQIVMVPLLFLVLTIHDKQFFALFFITKNRQNNRCFLSQISLDSTYDSTILFIYHILLGFQAHCTLLHKQNLEIFTQNLLLFKCLPKIQTQKEIYVYIYLYIYICNFAYMYNILFVWFSRLT